LQEGFIRLRPEEFKTKEGRLVALNQELVEMLNPRPRGLPGVRVFAYEGQSATSIKRACTKAVKKAGLEDLTFHDFRPGAINNWRLQGHEYFRIMAASGPKTISVCERYNPGSKEELMALAGEKIWGGRTPYRTPRHDGPLN
jgi:integrase